ncbi:MAG: glycosyltransferase family 39 protein [Smithellaceae bacterium]
MTKRNGRIAIAAVAVLFFCKALLLAFWVTPLWDVPDETGHFAYGRELMEKRAIPVLDQSVIDLDIMSHVRGKEVQEHRLNWIAQHPPVYYIGAGFAWKVATYLTADPQWLFKSSRVMSALAGALTLAVLYGLLVLATGDRLASLSVSVCVGCIPMFTHMSSGTNHDTTVTLFAALAVFFWIRFLREKQTRHAYLTAMWLSLACVTKMTALLLVFPMLLFMAIELALPWRMRIAHMTGIACTVCLLPGLWMLRTFHLHGDAFAVADGLAAATGRLDVSLWDYLSKTEALDIFYVFFWGMFGFAGTYRDIILLRIGGWPLTFYSWVSLVLVFLMALVLTRRFFKNEKTMTVSPDSGSPSLIAVWYGLIENRRFMMKAPWVLLVLAALLGVLAYQMIYSPAGAWVRLLFFSGSVFVACSAAMVLIKPLQSDERLVCYSILTTAFFMLVFVWTIHSYYLKFGYLWGVMGRYYFPLIPLMLTAVFLPLVRWLKIPSRVFVACAFLFVLAEMATLFGQVIPLWRNV